MLIQKERAAPLAFPRWIAVVGVIAALTLIGALASQLPGDQDDDNQGSDRPLQTVTGTGTVATIGQVVGSPATSTAVTATGTTRAATQIVSTPTVAATITPTTAAPTATSVPPTETASPTPTNLPQATATEIAPATATLPPPTDTPIPAPVQRYQANWSQGMDGWTGDPNWYPEEGMLKYFGAPGGTTIYSPYNLPGNQDYTIEAEVQIVDANPIGAFTGFAFRDPAGDQRRGGGYAIFDTNWHTYRLEVRGERVTFLLDGNVIGQITDPRYRDPGNVGLYTDAPRLNVRAFRVE